MEEVGNIADTIRQGLRDGTLKSAPHRFECPACFNCGFREVNDPDRTSSYRGVVVCSECEYWNLRRQKRAA